MFERDDRVRYHVYGTYKQFLLIAICSEFQNIIYTTIKCATNFLDGFH